jgi:hypothetical protein
MADEQTASINLAVNRTDLYREESFTDLRACTIRQLSPVNPDGSPDKGRKILYVGQTHVVTPAGPLPIQGVIQAKDLQQAFKKFPEAMKTAMEHLIEEAKKAQQQEQSRIVVPGR